ncbi:MAG: D-glycerate 3-kinase [Pseudohongiellaceae bacterium]|jgi:D-glycerate 3-kinase
MQTHNYSDLNQANQELLDVFCAEEKLPEVYQLLAQTYFLPLAAEIVEDHKASAHDGPLIIGINGSQGSGKSTLALLLSRIFSARYNKKVANLSIDDFYKTKAERQRSAADIHPLLLTRGVPGTHDTTLLNDTLQQLCAGETEVVIPRFDKSTDDRHPESAWEIIHNSVDIILLEGWCLGVRPETSVSLGIAINALEQEEDAQGSWRKHINDTIKNDYMPIFEQLDKLIMLKAPSFECVYDWRQKQEDKLRDKTIATASVTHDQSGIMSTTQLQRFIQHYERLTVHMLATLPKYADIVFKLGSDHSISERLDRSTP